MLAESLVPGGAPVGGRDELFHDRPAGRLIGGQAAGMSCGCRSSASASAMASSIASRVPEPMEKWMQGVADEHPVPGPQRSFLTFGKLRQIDLFEISSWPSSVSLKTASQQALVSSGPIVANPARAQLLSSVSTMNVLISGV